MGTKVNEENTAMISASGDTTLGSFSAVDSVSEGADVLVTALDEIAALPAVRRLRAAATEMLAPRLGDRLLDVGCGIGDEVRLLAAAVGPEGSVIGVDSSETMLAEARKRTIRSGGPIEYRLSDATRLDVATASVDGCRCERVLQHIADPSAVMAELVRVTRPGGRIAVIDSDWGMHSVHGADPDVTGRVLASWADHAANGWSGRQLPALFASQGMVERMVVAETLTSVDPTTPTRPPFPQMAAAACGTGAITDDEATAWLAQLVDAGSRHEFFWAVTMFAVGASRPI